MSAARADQRSAQLLRHARHLEVAAIAARPAAHLEAELLQVARQLRPVPRAVRPRRAEQLARVHRRETPVRPLARRAPPRGSAAAGPARRHAPGHASAGSRCARTPPRADAPARSHRKLAADTGAHQLDVALDPRDRPRDRPAMRRLDLRTLIRRGHRPQRRHRLRRAERQIDPRDPRAVPTGPPKLMTVRRRDAAHQGREIAHARPGDQAKGQVQRAAPGEPCQRLGARIAPPPAAPSPPPA